MIRQTSLPDSRLFHLDHGMLEHIFRSISFVEKESESQREKVTCLRSFRLLCVETTNSTGSQVAVLEGWVHAVSRLLGILLRTPESYLPTRLQAEALLSDLLHENSWAVFCSVVELSEHREPRLTLSRRLEAPLTQKYTAW